MRGWPFETGGERNRLSLITTDGFGDPIPGVVYTGATLDGGVPLGGLGTGYLTLEGTGKIGHVTIYNDIVPPRRDFREWLTILTDDGALPLSTASIDYFGHFPIADLRATFPQASLGLGIRAFAPFNPGNAATSNVPAALFEIEIANQGTQNAEVRLQVAPPRPPVGELDAIAVRGSLVGEDLASLFGEPSPEYAQVESAPLAIPAGEARRVRVCVGWYRPEWRDSSREPHVHRYGQRFASAAEVASTALRDFDVTLGAILAWQGAIYGSSYPDWVRDWLVQSLYSLAKNTVWIAKTRKDEWWGEDGWFTHNESHTGCPITETMVCRMHGHFPALFFFPELEASTLDAFRHFQIADGEIPFSYGMQTSMRDPRYHCQHPLNSGQYAQMIYRQYLRTSDREQMAAFYPSAKAAIAYQFSLDDDDDGLVNDQAHLKPGEHWPANQFYDVWPWWGTSAYVAGTWLATLAIGIQLAEEAGDADFRKTLTDWFERGLESYEAKLWNGEYYRLWNDPDHDRLSEVSLGNQLMAQWCVKVAGLDDILPEDRVQSALRAVERLNVAATRFGLVNGVTPDGERFDAGHRAVAEGNDHAKQTFVGEGLCAAMTQLYHGRVEVGTEMARRIYEAVVIVSRSPWNQRCLFDAATGLPVWGDDYYSNMAVWALPMALSGIGIGDFCSEGELVSRMIAASNVEVPA
jgi:uncharacterized protein (DUF608 family)